MEVRFKVTKTFAEKRNQWFEGTAKEFHLNLFVELIVLWTDASASEYGKNNCAISCSNKFDQTTKQSLTPDKGGV